VTKIMKASFDTGVVPDDWKTANVCPIFKSYLQIVRNMKLSVMQWFFT